jgi:hypothetical protein
MQMKHVLYASLATCAALALTACGGGSPDAGSAPQAADGSPAAANAAALTRAFAEFQKASPPPEVIDPETLQKSLPPPNDTAEPTPVS